MKLSRELTKKIGPLPGWAWAAGLGAFLYYWRGKIPNKPTADPREVPMAPPTPAAPMVPVGTRPNRKRAGR